MVAGEGQLDSTCFLPAGLASSPPGDSLYVPRKSHTVTHLLTSLDPLLTLPTPPWRKA